MFTVFVKRWPIIWEFYYLFDAIYKLIPCTLLFTERITLLSVYAVFYYTCGGTIINFLMDTFIVFHECVDH